MATSSSRRDGGIGGKDKIRGPTPKPRRGTSPPVIPPGPGPIQRERMTKNIPGGGKQQVPNYLRPTAVRSGNYFPSKTRSSVAKKPASLPDQDMMTTTTAKPNKSAMILSRRRSLDVPTAARATKSFLSSDHTHRPNTTATTTTLLRSFSHKSSSSSALKPTANTKPAAGKTQSISSRTKNPRKKLGSKSGAISSSSARGENNAITATRITSENKEQEANKYKSSSSSSATCTPPDDIFVSALEDDDNFSGIDEIEEEILQGEKLDPEDDQLELCEEENMSKKELQLGAADEEVEIEMELETNTGKVPEETAKANPVDDEKEIKEGTTRKEEKEEIDNNDLLIKTNEVVEIDENLSEQAAVLVQIQNDVIENDIGPEEGTDIVVVVDEEEENTQTLAAAAAVQEEKESPPTTTAAYNDVIEQTAIKLLEKRKNKVKALVGAFETIIDCETAAKNSKSSV